MKFEIINKKFNDKNIQNLIIKLFEIFANDSINIEREEAIIKSKNKDDMNKLLSDLGEYVESTLIKKFSLNFIVLINEYPNYAIKYEKNYLLGLKYNNYEIVVIKCPFITIPGKYYKTKKDYIHDDDKASIISKLIVQIKYNNKYHHSLHDNNSKVNKLEKFDDSKLKNIIIINTLYYLSIKAVEKDTSKLALGIQYDLALEDKDYK